MTGTLDLVTALLETLNKVVHEDSSGSGEKVFTGQLLMSAIENVATSIPATVCLLLKVPLTWLKIVGRTSPKLPLKRFDSMYWWN